MVVVDVVVVVSADSCPFLKLNVRERLKKGERVACMMQGTLAAENTEPYSGKTGRK